MSLITRGTVVEASAYKLYGQIFKADGSLALAADVSGLEYQVFQLPDTSAPIDSAPLTPADVVKATPETVDGVEYNLVWSPDPETTIPEGNRTYRIELGVTPQTGEPFYFLWELVTVDRHGG